MNSGGGFLSTSVTMTDPLVSTQDVTNRPTRIEGIDLQSDRYFFMSPRVQVQEFEITLAGSRHTGPILAVIQVDPSWMFASYDLVGIQFRASLETSTLRSLRYILEFNSTSEQAVRIGSSPKGLSGELSAILPKGAQNVRLNLDPRNLAVTLPICVDPTVASFCRVDPILTKTQEFVLPSGSALTVFGTNCADRLVLAEVGDSWGVNYRTDALCGVEPDSIVESVQGPPEHQAGTRDAGDVCYVSPASTTNESYYYYEVDCPIPDPPAPPQPGSTYHHAFTWIEDPPIFGLDLAELETVARASWDQNYAWWGGWAYAIANDTMPHWQTNTPAITFVENECSSSGPARCTAIRYAVMEETWTVADVIWWADCGKPPDQDQAVYLEHSHQLTRTGHMATAFWLVPCPGLYPHHVNFEDPNQPYGVYVREGPSASITRP